MKSIDILRSRDKGGQFTFLPFQYRVARDILRRHSEHTAFADKSVSLVYLRNGLVILRSTAGLCILFSCFTKQNTEYIIADPISVNNFSSSVELMISDPNFLEDEILKINAKNPSVQRILINSDAYLRSGKLIEANSELERALRITKKEGAIYLRLAHLRHIQGIEEESRSFASRALLLSEISSWERLLLNVYLRRSI